MNQKTHETFDIVQGRKTAVLSPRPRQPIIIEGQPQTTPLIQLVKPEILKFKYRPSCPDGYQLFRVELGYYHYERRTEWWAILNDYVGTWKKAMINKGL